MWEDRRMKEEHKKVQDKRGRRLKKAREEKTKENAKQGNENIAIHSRQEINRGRKLQSEH